MAYNIVAGDVIEWTVKCNLYAQTCLNVGHFRAGVGWVTQDSVTVFNAMNTELGVGVGSFMQLFRDTVSVDVTVDEMIFQKIWPTRFARVAYIYNVPGVLADPANTANISAVLTKRSELSTVRSAHAKTGQIGSFHIPGVPATQYTQGILQNAYVTTKMQPLADELVADFTDPTLNHMDYVLFHRTATPPSANKVFEIFTQNTVRTMRGRTSGKGI